MGKPSNKKRGKLSPMSQFELRSFQTKSSTTITGGYRDAIDSEYDFEIEGQEEFEAVSDITAITRAVDVDPVDQSPQDPKRFRLIIFVPCLLFFLSLLAVAFARGKGGIDNGGIQSSRTRTEQPSVVRWCDGAEPIGRRRMVSLEIRAASVVRLEPPIIVTRRDATGPSRRRRKWRMPWLERGDGNIKNGHPHSWRWWVGQLGGNISSAPVKD